MSPAKIVLLLVGLLLLLVLVVLVGRGVSALAYERDHPTEANQWLRLFLPPKSPEMSRYFPDPKVAAFAQDVRNGRARGVKQALADGIDVNAQGNQGFRPIFFAVYPHQDATVLRLLLAARANPNVHLSNGATPCTWRHSCPPATTWQRCSTQARTPTRAAKTTGRSCT